MKTTKHTSQKVPARKRVAMSLCSSPLENRDFSLLAIHANTVYTASLA